jgi:KDO2-lipid IV(A) lauroyltransferase
LPNGEYTKFFYTREYYRLLEQSIQKHPEFWLWSHNRWKRDRKEFNELFSEEEQKKRLSRL